MKVTSATIYSLRIPFLGAFAHKLKSREHSDAIVVKLTAADGSVGFGEGLARPYVTGETTEGAAGHIKESLIPAVLNGQLPDAGPDVLADIGDLLPEGAPNGVIAWPASRSAVELALLDCLLRSRNESLAELLPPKTKTVTYSGVIASGTVEKATELAEQCKAYKLPHIKIKVGSDNDLQRIQAVRDTVGPAVSIRLDANGAFDLKQATEFITALGPLNIDCLEQPMPRGKPSALAELRSRSAIPLMVDESLVTLADAEELIESGACDYFNLRVSKCGGIGNTLLIARMAKQAGLKVQLGCQVGETAILSAAGRHLAAHLPQLEFVEGSYGKLLLVEDVAEEDLGFGRGGESPLLTAEGLGIKVLPDRLRKYAHNIIEVE